MNQLILPELNPLSDNSLPRDYSQTWLNDFVKDSSFLEDAIRLANERWFNLQETPCWTKHPDIILELVGLVAWRRRIESDEHTLGSDINLWCEKAAQAFDRISVIRQRCKTDCIYDRYSQLTGKFPKPQEPYQQTVIPVLGTISD